MINEVYVVENDEVKKGAKLFSISNESIKLSVDNAKLAANFSDYKANENKILDFKNALELSKTKYLNDSLMFERQKALWEQKIGSKVEFEQRELAYKSSKTTYISTKLKLEDLKKQLKFSSDQSKKNLEISRKNEVDFTVKSEIDGKVYALLKKKGEMVNVQTTLAVIGDSKSYLLELQVDEYDIVKIKKDQKVMLLLDSYKGKVFEAKISTINPIMNERTKTFTVKAIFDNLPEVIYPNLTVEANIVLNEKNNVLTIPRSYLLENEYVMLANGEKTKVKTGLKDYQKVEILEGITAESELVSPLK